MTDRDEPQEAKLSDSERREVEERKSGSSRVIHEVVREEGEEELARPALSLICSGLAAGVAMNASILAKTFLHEGLPDAPWRSLVESLGYTLGFVITVLARMQLYTESTVTAVLPISVKPTRAKLAQILRLWGLVFASNMVGTLLVALMLQYSPLFQPGAHEALMAISREVGRNDAWRTLVLGIPAGFLLGSVAWMLPNNRGGSEFFIVFGLTYLIGIGHFSHVVAGSTEAWMLWLDGGRSFLEVLGGLVLPSLVGNTIGGTLLFAVLAHGQVRGEIRTGRAG